MAESEFPKTADEIVATLTDIYRHQSEPDMVELLESAIAHIEEIEYDNWNGGTYSYALMLDVPVSVFVSVESKLQKIEKSMSSKLAVICRNVSNHYLSKVTITPLTSKLTGVGPRVKPPDAEVKHIWKEGYFRLFLSHVSAHKVAVAEIKSELQLLGISGFVAHEDITPSLEWQNEIELALRSMHSLAALLTPDFHQSNWTDQEIGFALGQGVLVVPVRLGADPYGFIGKVQGLSGSLVQPTRVAGLLSSTLLNHPSTHREMCRGIAFAFEAAGSYASAIALSKVISTITDFTQTEKEVMQRACKTNPQVINATGVVARVRSVIGLPEPNKVAKEEDIPF